MSDVSTDDIWRIAEQMAQDLQEYVDAGEAGGSKMQATKDLLEEFEELRRQAGRHWLDRLGAEALPSGLADL